MNNSIVTRAITQYRRMDMEPIRRMKGGIKFPSFELNNRIKNISDRCIQYKIILNSTLNNTVLLNLKCIILGLKYAFLGLFKKIHISEYMTAIENSEEYKSTIEHCDFVIEEYDRLVYEVEFLLNHYHNVDDINRLTHSINDILSFKRKLVGYLPRVNNVKNTVNQIKNSLQY